MVSQEYCGHPYLGTSQLMGNELALDVNVLWLLIVSLFFVFIVTAAAWRVIAVIACAGVDLRTGEGTRDRSVRSRGMPEAAAET